MRLLFGKGDVRNAALAAGGRQTAITLRRGSYDARRATIRYRITPMRGQRIALGAMRRPTLFIDSLTGYVCGGQLNNHQNVSLTVTGDDDPGFWQRMNSNPGNIGPLGYSSWSSEGNAIGEPCDNDVTYSISDISGNLVGSVEISISVPNNQPNHYSCTVLGPSGTTSDAAYACNLNPVSDTGGDSVTVIYDLDLT